MTFTVQSDQDDESDGEECEDEERLDDAEEWIDYNMAGAYLGPDAPVIAKMREKR